MINKPLNADFPAGAHIIRLTWEERNTRQGNEEIILRNFHAKKTVNMAKLPKKKTAKSLATAVGNLSKAMSKAGKALKPAKRRVTIPAGKEYVVIDPKETVYLVLKDGSYSHSLQALINREKAVAFEEGQKSPIMQSVNARNPTKEETLQSILKQVRSHHGMDQNEIVAVLLNCLRQDREKRIASLNDDKQKIEQLLGQANECNEGFNNVRTGGFDKLGFR